MIGHIEQIPPAPVLHPEARDAVMRVPVTPENGWDGYVMRVFDVAPGGYTPRHDHPWPHINYVLDGEAVLFLEGREQPIKAGSFAYVPAGSLHQFRNTGERPLRFICIVPEEGHQ